MSGIKNIKKKLKGFQVRPPNAEVIKKVLLHIPYMVVFYVVNKCTWLYQYCRGSTVVDSSGNGSDRADWFSAGKSIAVL